MHSCAYISMIKLEQFTMPHIQNTPHYEHLKNKWTKKKTALHKNLWKKHSKALHWIHTAWKNTVVGSAGAAMLLATPLPHNLLPRYNVFAKMNVEKQIDKRAFLIFDLSSSLPDKVEPLTLFEEQTISQTLSRHFGFPVTPILQNKKLNTSYGYIGQEQHLARYPGDSIETHFDNPQERSRYAKYGMAPGKGAWGYFARSESELRPNDIEREKYYIAVQTFLSPGYNEHVNEYYQFYKYRKMLVVNPQNGKAIVAGIGDAGPASWTGKQLGGSPEVMQYLERVDGAKKGPVLYFFIDDPTDTILLGPINPK